MNKKIIAKEYWEKRYRSGRTSGMGSYGKNGKRKTEIVNNYIKKYSIKSILDLGCGDGNQTKMLKGFEKYVGYDISEYVIELCSIKFSDNNAIKFYTDINKLPTAELCLSLDVIYHILDEVDFVKHMSLLFTKSTKYVLIFSTECTGKLNKYILHHKFKDYIKMHHSDFELIEIINGATKYSTAFYLYKKITKNKT